MTFLSENSSQHSHDRCSSPVNLINTRLTPIAFFLRAITLQARENSARVRNIMGLYEHMKHQIQHITRSQYSVHLLDALFSRPIFRTTDIIQQFEEKYGIHPKTTPALLRQLRDAGILLEIKPASGRRPAVLCFAELLEITEGQSVFQRT